MKKLIKLWKLGRTPKTEFCPDSNNDIYYLGEDGWYTLEPYTGEVELTSLPAVAKIEGKRVEVIKGGENYSLMVDDKIDLRTGGIRCVKNVIYYAISKGGKKYFKVYNIESGEKIYELKRNHIYCYSSINSRYLLIDTFNDETNLREIVAFDVKGMKEHKIDSASSALLPIEPILFDMAAVVYIKHDLVKLLISFRDSLREYMYSNSINISSCDICGSLYMNVGHCGFKKQIFIIECYISKEGVLDFTILNLDGEIKHRWITSPKKFEKLLKIRLDTPKLTSEVLNIFGNDMWSTPLILSPFFSLLNVFDNTYVFSADNQLVALEIEGNSVRRKWIKKFHGYSTFHIDLIKPYCLIFNYKNFEGKIINLQDRIEICSETLPDKPDFLFNGIILFKNGTAYGVKGIFEEAYVKALEKLLKAN
ncbi:MAG: hypothetical protein B6U95_02370 [Thermofilum sp. ex4484_82]|nr:MAG: hypothetical protein B6U95_02370 [Thermofilum sp. ex4484_82]OYT39301.1 MAG: hypothetical protein B6U96_02370 [Archaeoglobales archaeon ex4484_92]